MDEEIDDVDVDVNGSEAVVIDAELDLVPAADDQLCVVDDVEAEDEDAGPRIHQVDPLGQRWEAHRPDGHHQEESEKAEDSSHQIRPAPGEVPLRQTCISGEPHEHHAGGCESEQHRLTGVHGAQEPDHDRLENGEREQEQVVRRERPSNARATTRHAQEQDQGSAGRHVEEVHVLLHPCRARVHMEPRCDAHCDRQLHAQDAVDLPDEADADI
mmetsp:Transcript_35660/g.102738  ORF Transcript_35660/g.102738 Transcript_35660/m.102738 type:complete len:214 (-) Transcript_35660:74-715(-)